jgi:hypothetical protein
MLVAVAVVFVPMLQALVVVVLEVVVLAHFLVLEYQVQQILAVVVVVERVYTEVQQFMLEVMEAQALLFYPSPQQHILAQLQVHLQ